MDANFFFNSNPRPLPGRRASPVDRLAQGRQGLNLGGSTPVGNLETQPTLPISYDSGVILFSPRGNPFLDSPYGYYDPRLDFSRQRTSLVVDHTTRAFDFRITWKAAVHELNSDYLGKL